MFTTFTTINYISNSNLTVPEETASVAATSTSDKFFATFTTFANTNLKKKSNMCECNLFLSIANRQ